MFLFSFLVDNFFKPTNKTKRKLYPELTYPAGNLIFLADNKGEHKNKKVDKMLIVK